MKTDNAQRKQQTDGGNSESDSDSDSDRKWIGVVFFCRNRYSILQYLNTFWNECTHPEEIQDDLSRYIQSIAERYLFLTNQEKNNNNIKTTTTTTTTEYCQHDCYTNREHIRSVTATTATTTITTTTTVTDTDYFISIFSDVYYAYCI